MSRIALAILVSLIVVMASASIGTADDVRGGTPPASIKIVRKCRAAIVKAGSGFTQAKAKALQKCHESIVKGKRPAGTDCRSDVKTAAVITKAGTKLRTAIVKACGGKDKTCGTPDANGSEPSLADIGWNIGQCPNFERGSCTNAIASCSDIPTCLECIGEKAVDQAMGLYYDALAPSDPAAKDKAEKTRNKCQQTIGKAATKFLLAKSKTLAKCWTTVNKTGTGTCPDGKAADKIAKAEAKKRATIAKACQGPDKLLGTSDDLTPVDIGFLGSCPSVTIPGGASCVHAVDTLGDLIDCVDCVTEFKADCVAAAAVPAFVTPYPAECNPAICTLTLQPTASSSVQFRSVLWSGTGYTPNGVVEIIQPSAFLGLCRGIVIIPGTTITADADGNFSQLMPPTALSFSITSQSGAPAATVVQAGATDQATGCSSPLVNYPLTLPGPDPSDSLTLLYVPSPSTSTLAPPAMPLPNETGSGTVTTGQCQVTVGVVELRFTLSGAVPNRTLTMFVTPPASSPIAVGSVTTDGAGNVSSTSYLPHCFPNLGSSSTLSLTIDGNAPGVSNEAYRSVLVRNVIPVC